MRNQELLLDNRAGYKAAILASFCLALMSVSQVYSAPETQPATMPTTTPTTIPTTSPTTAPVVSASTQAAPMNSAQDDNQVLATTRDLFKIGFNSSLTGSLVLGALHSTYDPGLKDYFLAVSRTTVPELQLIALLDANGVSRDPSIINPQEFLANQATDYVSPSLAMLIQYGSVTDAQLEEIERISTVPAQRLMAAAELVDRGKYSAAADALKELVQNVAPEICYYSALTLMEFPDAAHNKHGMELLEKFQANREYILDSLKVGLLARVADQKITKALPWVLSMARDADNSYDVRLEALSTLFTLNDPAAPGIYSQLLSGDNDIIGQLELGMAAIRFGSSLSPADIAPLAQADTPLLQGIAHAAQLSVQHKDPTQTLLDLILQGQPIYLNWLLDYATTPQAHDRVKLLTALINYAVIADGDRDQDYQRGLQAAQAMADADTAADRAALAGFLDSPNHAVVEVALAGMLQSKNGDFAPIVFAYWNELMASTDDRVPDFAALILGKAGNRIALPQLKQIVINAVDRSVGFRAVAGWYYLKIVGKTSELLQSVDNPTPPAPASIRAALAQPAIMQPASTQPVAQPATQPTTQPATQPTTLP